MYFLTGMIAADRTASGDITQMVQIRMELRRLIRGGIGLAVLLLVAFGSGKRLNVVKEEKDGWYMTARNTVRERLDETIADAKECLTGQKMVRAKEESEKKKEAQKAAKSTAESQKAKSTDDTDPARLKRKLPVLETTGASGTANSILKDEIGNLNQITDPNQRCMWQNGTESFTRMIHGKILNIPVKMMKKKCGSIWKIICPVPHTYKN